jgi:DNA repair protein RadA/Sms
MKCIHCNAQLAEGRYKCINPKCRMWNVASGSNTSMEDCVQPLGGKDAAPVERIITGVVDKCFGGGKGIAKTAVILLAGDPGAGKTTLCLQLSDIFAGLFDKKVLYIANEQHYSELNDTAIRLQLKHMQLINIVKAMGGVQHDIGQMLLHYKPCLTILDSVTKWSGEDVNEAVTICQRFKDYTVRLNAPTIVINQVTKSGDHAGLNKMQHAVDCTAMFEILGDNPEDPRRLHVRKNRNGPAPISQYFEMVELGVFEIDEAEAMGRLDGPAKPENNSSDNEENEEEE